MKKCFRSNNQEGFVLITAMLFLVLLTIIGILATDTTNIELQIAGNDHIYKNDFYNQEMSLAVAKIKYHEWMTTTYLITSETAAFFPPDGGTDANDNGINDLSEVTRDGKVVSSYKVRNIVSTAANISGWEDIDAFGGTTKAAEHPANQVPQLPHRDKPIPGTGYDPKNFEIRRFVITAYSPRNDRKVILQEGIFKAFNKYN